MKRKEVDIRFTVTTNWVLLNAWYHQKGGNVLWIK